MLRCTNKVSFIQEQQRKLLLSVSGKLAPHTGKYTQHESFPKLARMCLSHDRSYHTWVLFGLQGFRHLFKRTCWAIWLLGVTGSGTWRPGQLLRKGEKIKSTLWHLFLSLLKCLTPSKQSLCCSLSTSLPHLSLLLCILILIDISKRFMLQLWQVCPGSIVGCLIQLLLPFSVEEPSPLWADVCLEESLQLRPLHRPQEDHGLCTTQSRGAIKPPQGFPCPLAHMTLPPSSLFRVLRLVLSRAVQESLTSLWWLPGCGAWERTLPSWAVPCHACSWLMQDPRRALLPRFSLKASRTPPLHAGSASLPTL